MKYLKPLDWLKSSERCACVWVNGIPSETTVSWLSLWNQSALRWATDGAANTILARENYALPHAVSGDMDSIRADSRAELISRGVAYIETPDQNFTDLTKALRLIVRKIDEKPVKVDQIIVMGGLSGRFDHTLSTINSIYTIQRETGKEIYVQDGMNVLCVLLEDEYSIDLDRSQVSGKCGLVPFCQRKTVVTTEGLRWNLADQELSFGGIVSTSNEFTSSMLIVKTSAPLIFTFELAAPANHV